MEDLIRFLIASIVDHKDDVVIESEGDTFLVTVHKDDIGRVIGKQGRVIKALRTLIKSANGTEGKKYYLKVKNSDEESQSLADESQADNADEQSLSQEEDSQGDATLNQDNSANLGNDEQNDEPAQKEGANTDE